MNDVMITGKSMKPNILSELPFCTPDAVDHLTTNHLHQLLAQVDPAMADFLHPHNRRKIIR